MEEFAKAAADHGKYTQTGNAPKTNAAYRRARERGSELRSLPDRGEAAFTSLTNHINPAVRTWAAYYLLPLNEKLAVTTLEQVSERDGILGLNARMTLREWNAGRLQIV